MNLLHYWRRWILPFFTVMYFILSICVALPLCILELDKHDQPKHVQAWFAGGIFVMCALPISFWGILQHLINYTQPHLQRHIIRILWMVPIYAVNAWFALRFPDAAIYLDTVRECYEAYVIYNFLAYLLNFLWIEHPQLDLVVQNKQQVKHIIPFCLLPPWPMTGSFIERCKHGALQYTIVRPVTTCIALICQLTGKYDEGDFNFTTAWSYLVVINNISQIWAMYCLILFYKAMKEELAPIKPVPKFLCVKFVVFFSFWQSVLIAALAKLNVIPQDGPWEFYGSINEVATGIQDFCICVEMFIAAIAHYFSFSHKPFINENAEEGNCCSNFLSMWDVTDMKDDVVEHVKVIGKTVTKTMSRSKIKTDESERTPLLQENNIQSGANGPPVQVTTDITASLRSCDWDTTSVEARQPYHKKSITTASMNNYIDFGSSIESEDKVNIKEPGAGKECAENDQGSVSEPEIDLNTTQVIIEPFHTSQQDTSAEVGISDNNTVVRNSMSSELQTFTSSNEILNTTCGEVLNTVSSEVQNSTSELNINTTDSDSSKLVDDHS